MESHGEQSRRNWTIPSESVKVLIGHFSLAIGATGAAEAGGAVVAVAGVAPESRLRDWRPG